MRYLVTLHPTCDDPERTIVEETYYAGDSFGDAVRFADEDAHDPYYEGLLACITIQEFQGDTFLREWVFTDSTNVWFDHMIETLESLQD